MKNKLLEIALSQYGIREIVGKRDNPEVLKYFDILGYDGARLKDETAWCSAYINWCAITAGLPYSGKLTARSWLNVGTKVTEPQLGDLVIFSRGNPKGWKGHVGVFIRKENGAIYTLGGNQGNQVNITPYTENRLLGYRRLA